MSPARYRSFLILLKSAGDPPGSHSYRFDRSVYFDKYSAGFPTVQNRCNLELLEREIAKWKRPTPYPESEWKKVGTLIAEQLLPQKLVQDLRKMQKKDSAARLVIKTDTGQLRSVPWELAYIEGLGFLALNPLISIVRCEPGIPKEHDEGFWATETSSVEVCFFGPGNAVDKMPLHPQRALQSILADLSASKSASNSQRKTLPLDLKFTPPFNNIHSWLSSRSSRQAQVLLFHGHGEESRGPESAKLLFESADSSRNPERVPAERFSTIIGTRRLRLAVICACYSGDAQDDSPWLGVATALHKGNVPAVVGFRRANMDSLVEPFECGFFQALSEERCVERALVFGRKRIHALAEPDYADWAAPVLYMRPQGVPEYWISNEHFTRVSLQSTHFDVLLKHTYEDLMKCDASNVTQMDILHALFKHYRKFEEQGSFTERDQFISQFADLIAQIRSSGEVLKQSIY